MNDHGMNNIENHYSDGYMEPEEEWEREGLLDPAWEKQQKKIRKMKYKTKARKYTQLELEQVVTDVQTGHTSLRKGAIKLGVSTFFLQKRVKGVVSVQLFTDGRGKKTVLSPEAEEDLANKLRVCAKWGYGLSKDELVGLVAEYCKTQKLTNPFKEGIPGRYWFRGFCTRTGLKLKNAEQLQKCRLLNTSDPFLIYDFYDKLEETAEELGIVNKREHYFNLDESPTKHDPSKTKLIAGCEQGSIHRTIQGSGRENTTVMACVCADGTLLPPLIIFKGQKLWTNWKGSKDIKGTFYSVAENGYITCAIFYDFLVKFCQTIKVRPLIIALDGHVSHLDLKTIELAMKEQIAILKFPSHTTDLLQPLDRTCFAPYKKKLDLALTKWQREHQRTQTKSEFVDLVCSVWHEGISALNIIAGFRSCGIFPIDRNKYPVSRLNPDKLQKYLEWKEKNKGNPRGENDEPHDAEMQDDVELNNLQDKREEECGENSSSNTDTAGESQATNFHQNEVICDDGAIIIHEIIVETPANNFEIKVEPSDGVAAQQVLLEVPDTGDIQETYDLDSDIILIPSGSTTNPTSTLEPASFECPSGSNTNPTCPNSTVEPATFESLLLSKIKPTHPPKDLRRQIQRESAVVTSEEFISKIQALQAPKKPARKSQSKSTAPKRARQPKEKKQNNKGKKQNDKENSSPVEAQEESDNISEKDYALVKFGDEIVVCFVDKISDNLEEAVGIRLKPLPSTPNTYVMVGPCTIRTENLLKKLKNPTIQTNSDGMFYQFESL